MPKGFPFTGVRNSHWPRISEAGSIRLKKQLKPVLQYLMVREPFVDKRGYPRMRLRRKPGVKATTIRREGGYTVTLGVWHALAEYLHQSSGRIDNVFRSRRNRCHPELLDRVLKLANNGLTPSHVNWLTAKDVIEPPNATPKAPVGPERTNDGQQTQTQAGR